MHARHGEGIGHLHQPIHHLALEAEGFAKADRPAAANAFNAAGRRALQRRIATHRPIKASAHHNPIGTGLAQSLQLQEPFIRCHS